MTKMLPKRKKPTDPLSIALLSWESAYSLPVGGLATHVTELAAALDRSDHEVHLFTRMGPGQPRYDCIGGVHYHRCPFDPNTRDFVEYAERMGDSFVRDLNEFEQLLGPFDVVHGHDWLSTHALRRVKIELDRPIAFTIHSTEYGRCGNQVHDGDSARIRHLEWEGAYVSNGVVCVSKALLREVHELYNVPLNKMTAIYNGVDVDRFDVSFNLESVRRRHDIGPDDPTVLFAGRMTWQKGPDLLVEAIPRLLREHPRAKFIFAGDGDMRHGLEDRALTLGAAKAVRFVGYRTGLELISLFKCADAVCVPSRNEPFGIVILEAWSAGKPVVVTRSGGPAEFVRHRDTGIVVSVNQEDIGRGVSEVLKDMDCATQMGSKGRHQAETRFSWNTIAAETEGVYREILKGGAVGGGPTVQETSPMSNAVDDGKNRQSTKVGKAAARTPTERIKARGEPNSFGSPKERIPLGADVCQLMPSSTALEDARNQRTAHH